MEELLTLRTPRAPMHRGSDHALPHPAEARPRAAVCRWGCGGRRGMRRWSKCRLARECCTVNFKARVRRRCAAPGKRLLVVGFGIRFHPRERACGWQVYRR